MATFTPPSIAEVSPVGVADSQYGPSNWTANPFGTRLMRFYQSRQRGVTVYKMSDGTYQIARAVPGLNVTVNEPYPATTPDQFPQVVGGIMEIASSTDTKQNTTFFPASQPQVSIVYYGGHTYTVSSSEAAALTAAGFGSYIT